MIGLCMCVCVGLVWYRYKHQRESRAVIGLIPWVALTLSLSGETSLCRSECVTRVKSFKFSRTATCGGCRASFKRTESLHDSYVLLVYDLGCKVLYARKPGRSHEGCKTCKGMMVSMLSINITKNCRFAASHARGLDKRTSRWLGESEAERVPCNETKQDEGTKEATKKRKNQTDRQ